MEENERIKISLGTAICIFIIMILILALIGTIIYYNKNDAEKNVEKSNNVEENINEITKELEENDENTTIATNVNLVEGTYIRSNKNKGLPSEGQIKFLKGNFTLKLGLFEISGKYDISDKNVKCNLENYSFEGNEEKTLENKNWEINFEIVNDRKVKVKSNNADEETEIAISLTNFFYEDAEYSLYDLNNFVGTWNTEYAFNLQGEDVELGTLFGSGYAHYGSKFILNEDGTFENYIQPIQSNEFSNTGTWEYQEYTENTDMIWGKIILKYDDDREEIIYLSTGGDSMTELIYSMSDNYQLHLYK